MNLRKSRWSKQYESAEEELTALLQSKRIEAERWLADEYEDFPAHKHPIDKQLWCVEGSIVFTINDKPITLQAGDALELPAGTIHSGKAGFSGCACYESPLQSKNPSIEVG